MANPLRIECFVCNFDQYLSPLVATISTMELNLPVCDRHSEEEIGQKMAELEKRYKLRAKSCTVTPKAQQTTSTHDQHKSRTSMPAETKPAIPQTTGAPPARTKKRPMPYTNADYLMQNLPPEANDLASANPLVAETAKTACVAHAFGQLEVATTALSTAYEKLKDIDKQDLPARTLNQRMKQVSHIARDIETMAGGGARNATVDGNNGDKCQ